MPLSASWWLQQAGLVAVVLLFWVSMASSLPEYLLPGPLAVGQALIKLATTPATLTDIAATTLRVLVGLVVGGGIGIVVGLVLGVSQRLESLLWPWLAAFGTVSSAVWAILALIWFGVSWLSTLFVVAACVLPILAVAVVQGARAVEPTWLEMGRSLGLSRFGLIRKIVFPALVPHIMAGVRSAFLLSWRISVVAEAMGSTSGIGYRLRQAADMVHIEQVFSWAILFVSLTICLEFLLLRPVERYLLAWRHNGPSLRAGSAPGRE